MRRRRARRQRGRRRRRRRRSRSAGVGQDVAVPGVRHLRGAGQSHQPCRAAARRSISTARSAALSINRDERAEEQARADIVEVGRRLWERGYVASNDGNISVRLDDSRLITTPKSVSKGFMTPDMMVITDLDGKQDLRRARSLVRAEDAPRGLSQPARRARRGARASADGDRLCRRRHRRSIARCSRK